MNNRKNYTAPSAELILLAAQEDVAAASWKIPDGGWWFQNGNHWGVNDLNQASTFGGQYNWYTNIGEDLDPEINK